MGLELRDACEFLQTIVEVPIHILDNGEAVRIFCEKYHYHDIQQYFEEPVVSALVRALHASDLACLVDPLFISLHLFLMDGTPVAFGPYCQGDLSEKEVLLLQQELKSDAVETREVMAYRSQFTLMSEQKALHYIYGLIHHVDPPDPPSRLRRISFEDQAFFPQNLLPTAGQRYADVINKRYAMEAQLREYILDGNYTGALKMLDALKQDVGFLLNTGDSAQHYRTSYIISGTIVRIFASEAGLPPILIDQITNRHMEIQAGSTSLDTYRASCEEMTRTLCREIRKMKSGKYSTLVQSVLYHLDHYYMDDISFTDLAENLDVSYNYMFSAFRKETGQTPNGYLTSLRMKRAEHLLLYTGKTVTEISLEVGIPDTNYFTKLFKKAYGCTPLNYRKRQARSDTNI